MRTSSGCRAAPLALHCGEGAVPCGDRVSCRWTGQDGSRPLDLVVQPRGEPWTGSRQDRRAEDLDVVAARFAVTQAVEQRSVGTGQARRGHAVDHEPVMAV